MIKLSLFEQVFRWSIRVIHMTFTCFIWWFGFKICSMYSGLEQHSFLFGYDWFFWVMVPLLTLIHIMFVTFVWIMTSKGTFLNVTGCWDYNTKPIPLIYFII